MSEAFNTDLLLDISILYRSTQKYYDKMLQSVSLTYAQLPILILIYENEGISLQQVAEEGAYDKGTITKQVKKLEQMGYIRVLTSKKDKRAKELYTTQNARSIMSNVYGIRASWWKHIIGEIPEKDMEAFSRFYKTMAISAREFAKKDREEMVFFAHKRLSVTRDPGKMSTILWTGGCNFRCPFCNRSNLIFLKEDTPNQSENEIIEYLKKRKNILEEVVISGGEPLMHEALGPFLEKIKTLGYLIRVETNGSYPERLQKWIEKGWIDAVSMTLKNRISKYHSTIGIEEEEIAKIKQCVSYLKQVKIDVDFTIVPLREYHTHEDLLELAHWVGPEANITLMEYKESIGAIQKGLHGYTHKELEELAKELQGLVHSIQIREEESAFES